MVGETLRIAHRVNSVAQAEEVLQHPLINGIEVDVQSVLGSKITVARHTQLLTFGFVNSDPSAYEIASRVRRGQILGLDAKYWTQRAIERPLFQLVDQVTSDGLSEIVLMGTKMPLGQATSKKFPHVGIFATINSEKDWNKWHQNQWGDGLSVHAKMLSRVEEEIGDMPIFVHHAGVDNEDSVIKREKVTAVISDQWKLPRQGTIYLVQ